MILYLIYNTYITECKNSVWLTKKTKKCFKIKKLKLKQIYKRMAYPLDNKVLYK